MSKTFTDVEVFLSACGQHHANKPVDHNDLSNLYLKLIEEEYKEFLEAVQESDEIEQLDACMDMIWVILGYCKMKGFDVYGAWNEVARSNLAKIDIQTGKVVKNEAGKVMKPEGWQPPQLDKFLKIE